MPDLTNLVVHEVSFCREGMNKHAKVALFKSRESTPIGKAIVDLGKMDMPAARGFAEILAENEARERSWAAEQKMWPIFSALRESLSSIASDASLDTGAKVIKVQQSVTDFLNALRAEWPDVAAEVEKIAKASKNSDAMSAFVKAGSSGDQPNYGGFTMGDEVKKIADLEKSVGELTGQLTSALAKAAAAEADCKTAKDELDGMKKAADEVLKIGEGDGAQEFRKSVVGDSTFAFMKAQEDRVQMAAFEKTADSLFGNLPGTATEKALILKAIASAPEAVRKSAETILTAANNALDGVFKTIGTTGGDAKPTATIGKAVSDFKAKAAELRKSLGIGHAASFTKARELHPDLHKAAYPDQAEAA